MAKRDQPPAESGAGSAADGDPEPAAGSRRQGPRGRQLLKVAAVFLAAAATGVLIRSDDPRLLRFGLLAALWVALLGAFAVARARHQAAVQERRLAEQRRVHERELEREAAARREFEARVAAETRREVAAEYEEELRRLRGELQRSSAAAHRAAEDERVRLALSADAGGARSGDGEAADRRLLRAVDTHELPAVVPGRADAAPWSDAPPAAVESVRGAEDSASGLTPVVRSTDRRVQGWAARVQGQDAARPGWLPEPPRQAVGNEWSSPGIAAPGDGGAAGEESAAEVSIGGNLADAPGAGSGTGNSGAHVDGPGAGANRAEAQTSDAGVRGAARTAADAPEARADAAAPARSDAAAPSGGAGHSGGSAPLGAGQFDGAGRSGGSAPSGAGHSGGSAPLSAGQFDGAAGSDRTAEPGKDAHSGGAVDSGGVDSAEAPEAGAHAAGTSVTELLAAYGDTGTRPGRRRRRG